MAVVSLFTFASLTDGRSARLPKHHREKKGKSVFSLTLLTEGFRLRPTWHASSTPPKKRVFGNLAWSRTLVPKETRNDGHSRSAQEVSIKLVVVPTKIGGRRELKFAVEAMDQITVHRALFQEARMWPPPQSA